MRLADAIERVLWTEEEIRARVAAMGSRIADDYHQRKPLMVGILSGCFPFLADLVRCIEIPLEIDFMSVSSYGAAATSSGVVRILKDLNASIVDRDVILVEDIIDTGLTLEYLVENLRTRHPRSLTVCALLDKVSTRTQSVVPEYVGFECPDAFVVGYGLDYAGLYRNLPYIGELKPEIYRGDP